MNFNEVKNRPLQDRKVSLPPISDILNREKIAPLSTGLPIVPAAYYYGYSNEMVNLPHTYNHNYKYGYSPSYSPSYGHGYKYYEMAPVRMNQQVVTPTEHKPSIPHYKSYTSPSIVPSQPVNTMGSLISKNIKRKTRNNLPKETTHILLEWLNNHLNHPYPNSFEKNELMNSTGLNQQQLSNWFINARRRKIKLLKEEKRFDC